MIHMYDLTCDYCRLRIRALAHAPHMYYWPPLRFIYIEERESPFIPYHHLLLFVFVFFELFARIHQEILGEVIQGNEDVLVGAFSCEVLGVVLVS
jgi:hypothetical protein